MTATTNSGTDLLHGGFSAKTVREALRKSLLLCGALYALFYVIANDLIAAGMTAGYSRTSQAISELSASGAPAQPFLTVLLPVFSLLLIGFGIGVWRSAAGGRALRATGALLVAQGVTAFLWLIGPMSQREVLAAHGGDSRDQLHLVLSAASVLFILGEIGFSAAALGKAFRIYAVVSLAAIAVAGVATGILSTRIAAGEPTPWLGLFERISMGGWLLWMTVLAFALLPGRAAEGRSGPAR